ncbi:MAG: zf-HC2 domain-containing protein, partial [Candidatus Acidiferrales bacterium]
CKTLVVELESYLDQELDAELRAEIEQHLGKCKKCRVIVDTTQKTIQIFCNSEPAPLPVDTRDRLHQALVKRLGRPRA